MLIHGLGNYGIAFHLDRSSVVIDKFDTRLKKLGVNGYLPIRLLKESENENTYYGNCNYVGSNSPSLPWQTVYGSGPSIFIPMLQSTGEIKYFEMLYYNIRKGNY